MFERYVWTDPKVFLRRMNTLIGFIEESGYGGSGKEAKDIVLAHINSWFDLVKGKIERDDIEEAMRIIDVVCAMSAGFYLPMYVWRGIQKDPGFMTFVRVASGSHTFYLCDDCRMPLIYPYDVRDGCPYCSDCFPGDKDHRIALK